MSNLLNRRNENKAIEIEGRSNWRRTYSVGMDLGDVGKTLEVVESTSANNGNLDSLLCCSMNEVEVVVEWSNERGG